jgi:hypothetical protein
LNLVDRMDGIGDGVINLNKRHIKKLANGAKRLRCSLY